MYVSPRIGIFLTTGKPAKYDHQDHAASDDFSSLRSQHGILLLLTSWRTRLESCESPDHLEFLEWREHYEDQHGLPSQPVYELHVLQNVELGVQQGVRH